MEHNITNKYKIIGGNKLFGAIKVQNSKNATLPIMSASLLCDGDVKIKDYPNIVDVDNMVKILSELGANIIRTKKTLTINAKTLDVTKLNCGLCKTMRSSIFLLGSLLAKFKIVSIVEPGGCRIGKRPIDIHIDGLRALGVEVNVENDRLIFNANKAHSGVVKLKFPSVGATENLIQFAVFLKGKTKICNAAKEPEVVDLCKFLIKAGAKISGVGTGCITIYGVDKLMSTIYVPISDRIASGTYMVAVAVCGGDVYIKNAGCKFNINLIRKLVKMGCIINVKNDILHIVSDGNLKAIGKIKTGCYPKFPTDLQSLMLVASSCARGKTIINERIFENRFLVVDELNKMGTNIQKLSDNVVITYGKQSINGAELLAQDLRGGASLILAGLKARGKTIVDNIHFIDRGYQNINKNLKKLGANIQRI